MGEEPVPNPGSGDSLPKLHCVNAAELIINFQPWGCAAAHKLPDAPNTSELAGSRAGGSFHAVVPS
jgi:hypothetical protein